MRHTISCLHAIIIMGQLLKIIFSYIVCQSWLISSQGWSMLHMALSHAAIESCSNQECKSKNEHTLKKKKQQPRVIKEFWELVQYHWATIIIWVDLRKGASSPIFWHFSSYRHFKAVRDYDFILVHWNIRPSASQIQRLKL